jgi:Ca-activated chloride channel family protein
VLTVGTEEGAPIAMQGQGFKRDSQGNIVLPKLDLDLIKQMSSELNVPWHQMSFDDKDWQYLLTDNALSSANKQTQGSGDTNEALERQFDLWADQGYWLIVCVIVIAAFAFRRGWLLTLVFLIGFQPENSFASVLDDAWQTAWKTKDQQGQQLFNQDPAAAAELFKDPNWKASSYYRAGDYEQAAEHFNVDKKTPATEQSTAYYNRANALAKAGSLEDAIKYYEKAIELDNNNHDATFNKQLVEQLLQQQEQQQKNSDDQNSDDKDSDESDENSSDKNDDQSEQNDSDQQSDNEDSNDQQSNNQDSNNKDQAEENDSKENESEEKKSEQQSSEEQQAEPQESEQEAQSSQVEEANDDLSREERQALEQWLNRIPDDPGSLLKRKFKYQYQQREHQDEGEVSW